MYRNMLFFKRLTAVVLTAALMGPMLPLEAKTRKGDKLFTQGRAYEVKKDWDYAPGSLPESAGRGPLRHSVSDGRPEGVFPGRAGAHRKRHQDPAAGPVGRGASGIPEGVLS